MRKIVADVEKVIKDCSSLVGDYEGESFSLELWNRCQEYISESPIEQILYCAFQSLSRINSFEDYLPFTNRFGQELMLGLGLRPQVKIDNYRVDFLGVYSVNLGHGKTREKSVIVECDSQVFHERTEIERRYEKKRDRFLIVKGYKVFHFTGAEIMKSPFRVVAEIIAYLTDVPEEDLLGALENYGKEIH